MVVVVDLFCALMASCCSFARRAVRVFVESTVVRSMGFMVIGALSCWDGEAEEELREYSEMSEIEGVFEEAELRRDVWDGLVLASCG